MTSANRVLLLVAFTAAPSIVFANPIVGVYVDDPRCDFIAASVLPEELGELVFPDDENIDVVSVTTNQTTCVDNPAVADYRVSITNRTGRSWRDLFFVADLGIALGNADGLLNAANAFSIDSVGVNRPLIAELGGAQVGIFEPGETWTFLVTDWGDPAAPTFGSLGVPSPVGLGAGAGSNASIVARPVSAPGALALAALALPYLRRPGWRRAPA